MVATTATYALPYQQSTDRPCDSAGVWCSLRDKVATELQNTESILARTAPAVPVCIMTATPATTEVRAQIAAFGVAGVVFDTIEFDSDGMCDFSRSKTLARPRRTGRYYAQGWADLLGGGNPDEVQMAIATGPVGPDLIGSQTHSSGSGFQAEVVGPVGITKMKTALFFDFDAATMSNPATLGYGLMFNSLSSVAFTITRARFSLFYLRDI